MSSSKLKFEILEKSWKKLKRLQPIAIELERVSLIREKDTDFLSNPKNLESLILALGLNDDGLEEIPQQMYHYCGQGLRIWQYPIQFSKYLVDLSKFKIISYMEVGIRHGGTFITTVEYLDKFNQLKFAIGVDIMNCPSMAEYKKINPRVEFLKMNTQKLEFKEFIEKSEKIDLVLIDANHEEVECRNEFNIVKNKANIVVFHDITNIDFPGVGIVWDEVKNMQEYNCYEYVEQYEGIGPYMGIGMAVRKDRQLNN